MSAPGAAAATAALTVVHGLFAVPSLSAPGYEASTCSVVASIAMSPHFPAGHAITGRHALSPGSASCPGAHGASGNTGSQLTSPSWTKPGAHISGAMPAG